MLTPEENERVCRVTGDAPAGRMMQRYRLPACQESMGAIVDRSQEHVGTSDVAIIGMRRRMLESIRRFQAGETPIGLDEPWQQIGAGAGEYVAARD